MPAKNRTSISIAQIEEALRASGGFTSSAAKTLGVTTSAISHRVKSSVRLQTTLAEIKDKFLDLAESELLKKINQGDLGAICFYLKCQGKHRGYVEKQFIESENKNINVNFIAPSQYETPEEWEAQQKSTP